jgi:uncharacterized YigZ family protein
MEEYITLGSEAETSFTEKKSLFIGNARPVKTEEEAMEFITKIRKKYGDATHNCYAYMLANGSARYSDDGEPQGTAGVPILSVIQKGGFTDAVIVVTRYFGGILLGAGGLVRAYSASARDAVNASKIVTYAEYTEFSVKCSYSDYQRLIPVIGALGIKEDASEFTDNVSLCLAAKPDVFNAFCDKIAEIGAGRITVKETGKRFSE